MPEFNWFTKIDFTEAVSASFGIAFPSCADKSPVVLSGEEGSASSKYEFPAASNILKSQAFMLSFLD